MVESFALITQHSLPKCGGCRVAYGCCAKSHCEQTMEFTLEYMGVVLEPTGHPKLPLMGERGCIAAPHLRPLCSVHVCESQIKNDARSKQYRDLRERASDAMEAYIEEKESQLSGS